MIFRVVNLRDKPEGPCIRVDRATPWGNPWRIVHDKKEASWDDVLERAASNIKDIKEKYGTETIWAAVLASSVNRGRAPVNR